MRNPPRGLTVEVVVPKIADASDMRSKGLLVYELHITNFGPSALKLTEIQIYSGTPLEPPGDADERLADYSGAALSTPEAGPGRV
jgi:hypothetical protein